MRTSALKSKPQVPRRLTHEQHLLDHVFSEREFNYSLNYKNLDLRSQPELYRVGRSEQGVLLVEPYKSEILPHWKFKTPGDARVSSRDITRLFEQYRDDEDFVGMDMARKFLQMGYTRSRRYANHASGRKYDAKGKRLPFKNDSVKAESADIFWDAWKAAEADPTYEMMKSLWRLAFG